MFPDTAIPDLRAIAVTATVVVLFHPEPDDLANLAQMASWGQSVVAVVNACDMALAARLPVHANIHYIRNEANAGLAHALNQGIAAAMERGADYALLLDQDSRPDTTMCDRLVAVAEAIQAASRRLACVAPALIDRKLASADRATTGTLATSGTLVTRAAWKGVGPMWEDLFIDGIDHEWCFRARARGFETIVSPGVTMSHNMGEGAISVFGRFKPIHRSAVRHYFIVRNTLWLARRDYIPLRWRTSEVLKLAYRAPAYVFFSNRRMRTGRNLVRALIDGVRTPRMVSPGRFL
jgi:rhamnosyltransferase